jgi:hypothetical protein
VTARDRLTSMSLLVADASPVVGFATANEHPLLWQVVSTLYGQLLVPHHVDREISRTAAKTSRKAAMNYAWMKQQGQPTVLAEVTVVDPVAATAATLLGVGARRQFGEREKDVGEALTVAHAKHLRRQGHPADVLVDDSRGQRFADALQVPSRNNRLGFGHAIDIGQITTAERLREAYDAVSRYSQLLKLAQTGLLARLIPESPLAMSTHPAVRVENAGCCSRICNSSRSVARARVWWSLGGSAAKATSRGPV